ncbi:hypothetical protein [Caenispirillum salinarum]|uniref:hypothetical protein n=1 Tax=Caenispirillum salinarum TaxID=859058 RepID=UPI003850C724
MTRVLRLFVPVLLAGILSACAAGDGVVVTRSTPTTGDALAISSFRAASAAGPVLMEVVGSPVAAPQADVASAIAARMPTPPGRAPTRYTTDAAQAGNSSTRVVLLFGVPQAVNGGIACRLRGGGPPDAAANPSDRTTLEAALCNGSRAVRAARLRGPAVTGLDDPALDRLLWRAARELVPLRDREENPRCLHWPC